MEETPKPKPKKVELPLEEEKKEIKTKKNTFFQETDHLRIDMEQKFLEKLK